MLGVLVDDRDPAAGLHHAADLAHRLFDLHGVLQRLRGIGAVEDAVVERQLRHRSGAGVNAFGNEAQHLLGDVEAPEFGLGLLLLEDAREAALAAADVEHALAAQIAQVLADQFDVIDARIDGGRKVLFVARGLVERGLDAGAQLGGELRAAWFAGTSAASPTAMPA